MDSTQFLNRMKHFIKSSDNPSTSTCLRNELSQVPRAAFTSGSDIKRFYESTVGKKSFDKTSKISETKLSHSETKSYSEINISKTPLNVNLLMKAVENADFKLVERILNGDENNVNCKDEFGWTPLMSACCSGNGLMVEFLLKYKPDLSLCDKRGNSCRDLAQAKGYQNITNILKQYIQSLNTPKTDQLKHSSEPLDARTEFYCSECKQSVENMSFKAHISSTVHNFHVASKRKMPTLYGIPESNKGFQILVKSGWNKEEGLGPSGEGHKFPPKTILKQDRTGLGARKYKSKVTHRLEDIRKEATPKNTFKRQLRSNKRNEQRHERNLRLMLS